MLFVCPKCKKPLEILPDGRAVCESRHSYDRSREGYYNLLLRNVGGTHGDNRDMVLARRDFLATGAYLPLAKKLFEVVAPFLFRGAAVLDAGCGEGYYTDYLERSLSEASLDLSFSGFDISREAIKYAARKNSRLSLAVAGSYDMPIADESVDLLLNLFSPLALSESLRVVRRGGHFVMAIPAENHLFGLKQVLYDTPYKNTVEDTALPGFSLVGREKLSYILSLDSARDVSSLFMMTPYAYRTGREAREKIMSLGSLKTEVEFWIFSYKKD